MWVMRKIGDGVLRVSARPTVTRSGLATRVLRIETMACIGAPLMRFGAKYIKIRTALPSIWSTPRQHDALSILVRCLLLGKQGIWKVHGRRARLLWPVMPSYTRETCCSHGCMYHDAKPSPQFTFNPSCPAHAPPFVVFGPISLRYMCFQVSYATIQCAPRCLRPPETANAHIDDACKRSNRSRSRPMVATTLWLHRPLHLTCAGPYRVWARLRHVQPASERP